MVTHSNSYNYSYKLQQLQGVVLVGAPSRGATLTAAAAATTGLHEAVGKEANASNDGQDLQRVWQRDMSDQRFQRGAVCFSSSYKKNNQEHVAATKATGGRLRGLAGGDNGRLEHDLLHGITIANAEAITARHNGKHKLQHRIGRAAKLVRIEQAISSITTMGPPHLCVVRQRSKGVCRL